VVKASLPKIAPKSTFKKIQGFQTRTGSFGNLLYDLVEPEKIMTD
jgi:hypothetical protein